jgi:hypothetical protein
MMFTVANTHGQFTAAQCELLSEAFDRLRDQGISAADAYEIVSDNWKGQGDTVWSLTGEPAPY